MKHFFVGLLCLRRDESSLTIMALARNPRIFVSLKAVRIPSAASGSSEEEMMIQ